MPPESPPSPTLELTSLSPSPTESISPDSPLLTPTSTTPQPAWLLPSRTRLQTILHKARTITTPLLRRIPRLSLKSSLIYIPLLYTLICLTLSIPPFASRLPGYTGTYSVGAIDLEVPLPKAQLIADPVFKYSHTPAFELETVLFTIYYPISKDAKSHKKPLYWIPKPISLTARGYARFAHADNLFIRPIFTFALWLIAGSITIPAQVDVPLYTSTDLKFPVVVFSHGMASSRTDYTNYLGELASRGTVIAAIEHRDGSSPGSFIKVPDQPAKNRVHFRESDLLASPSNNTPVDTPSLKKHQLAFRDAEIFYTIQLLQRINANSSIPCTRSTPESLASFASRLDFRRLITAGHSYGATATLQAIKSSHKSDSGSDSDSEGDYESPNPSVGGIALDPGKESGPLNADIDIPVLVIHSNSWSKTMSIFFGRPHFDTVRDLVQDVLNRTGAAWFLTSLGTSHPSVSDAPLIEPLLLSWTTGASLNVKEALKEYVRASDDFIKFLGSNKTEGLLDEEVTHREYNKWVSDERKASYSKDLARLWEIHVSPASLIDSKG